MATDKRLPVRGNKSEIVLNRSIFFIGLALSGLTPPARTIGSQHQAALTAAIASMHGGLWGDSCRSPSEIGVVQ
jgi:hypothetical protein